MRKILIAALALGLLPVLVGCEQEPAQPYDEVVQGQREPAVQEAAVQEAEPPEAEPPDVEEANAEEAIRAIRENFNQETALALVAAESVYKESGVSFIPEYELYWQEGVTEDAGWVLAIEHTPEEEESYEEYYYYITAAGEARCMGVSGGNLGLDTSGGPDILVFILNGDLTRYFDAYVFPERVTATWNQEDGRVDWEETEYYLPLDQGWPIGQFKSATLESIEATAEGLTLTYKEAPGDHLFVGGSGGPNMELIHHGEGRCQLDIPQVRLAEDFQISGQGPAANIQVAETGRGQDGRGIAVSFELAEGEDWHYRFAHDFHVGDSDSAHGYWDYVIFRAGGELN